jgi:hypothetical protein
MFIILPLAEARRMQRFHVFIKTQMNSFLFSCFAFLAAFRKNRFTGRDKALPFPASIKTVHGEFVEPSS